MPPTYQLGKIIAGNAAAARAAFEKFNQQTVDSEKLSDQLEPYSPFATTVEGEASAEGPGTFEGRRRSKVTFRPSEKPGWWIRRNDLEEQLDIGVSIRNVWTSARNIVLRSGNPHNYLRMVEHIVALRLGMGVDNLLVEVGSGDPPLFDRSSLDLLEAIDQAKIVETPTRATYVTVKEPVTISGSRGDFVTLIPAEPGDRRLHMDCAIDFASIIGKQRIRFDLTPETFRYGAGARTNATYGQLIYTGTLGKLFADTRHLGYNTKNILIHAKKRYISEPLLIQEDGRSLEAVWHRATLDLLAAIALIDIGRFAGTVLSYRAGHTLDARFMTLLYKHDLLCVCE